MRYLTKNEIIDAIINCCPQGKIYNRNDKNLRALLSGYSNEFFISYNKLNNYISSLLKIDKDNILLDKYKKDYGIPNVIFDEPQSKEELVFAITMMQRANTLYSVEDYERFLSDLGFEVKFYQVNSIRSLGFPYGFPMSFSLSSQGKDKYTWWYWVKETNTRTDFNNIGNAFPLQFYSNTTNSEKVKKILDYLAPDYLKLIRITTNIKTLYGL